MWYWVAIIIVILIVLEEGLYFLFNRLAFKKQTKKQLIDIPAEETALPKRRLFRRKH